LIAGAVGLLAASVLLVEKIALLEDPTYVPSCSINPILSCGSIMKTDQSEAFGFPNPIIGVAGFAIVVTVGAGILAGGRFRRALWLGLQAGATFDCRPAYAGSAPPLSSTTGSCSRRGTS